MCYATALVISSADTCSKCVSFCEVVLAVGDLAFIYLDRSHIGSPPPLPPGPRLLSEPVAGTESKWRSWTNLLKRPARLICRPLSVGPGSWAQCLPAGSAALHYFLAVFQLRALVINHCLIKLLAAGRNKGSHEPAFRGCHIKENSGHHGRSRSKPEICVSSNENEQQLLVQLLQMSFCWNGTLWSS